MFSARVEDSGQMFCTGWFICLIEILKWFCISKFSIIQGIPISIFKLFPTRESSEELQLEMEDQNEASTSKTNNLNDRYCNNSISESKGFSVSECCLFYGYNYAKLLSHTLNTSFWSSDDGHFKCLRTEVWPTSAKTDKKVEN